MTQLMYDRTFALDDIEIMSRAKGGDGRTVTAYAAVFDTPSEVQDVHGHYIEQIDRAAFNMTINSGGASKAMVLYHHGRTLYNTPSELGSVPLGSPVEVRADNRGLLTVARYNRTQLADAVLESIANGDITAQSFRGRIFRSDPMQVPKVKPGQALPNVRRLELGLTDFGPTPTAQYKEAEILAVRTAAQLAQDVAQLDEAGRAELIRELSTSPGWNPETAAILATPSLGAGAEEPRDTHSIRVRMLRVKAELAQLGAQ